MRGMKKQFDLIVSDPPYGIDYVSKDAHHVALANDKNPEDIASWSVPEMVRLLIEQLAIPHAQSPLGIVTISIGVAIHHAGNAGTMANLLRAADDALYLAKGAGRNRVHLSVS
jgi:diguanylate cyclase (GGDEF)-like protein